MARFRSSLHILFGFKIQYKIFFISLFFALLVLLGLFQDLYAEEAEEGAELPEFSISISKFRVMPKYYGVPLYIKAGHFYRKNDFSIFPNFGINLNQDAKLHTSAGIVLQKRFFTWQIDAFYSILPHSITKSSKEQLAHAVNVFAFYINKTKLGVISAFGNKQRISSHIKEESTNFELSQGFSLDAFLLDAGYFKSTLDFVFFVDWQPYTNFLDYRINFALPATFILYYVDVAFIYSFYGTGRVDSELFPQRKDYIIEKTQSTITGRYSFKDAKRYSFLHLFGSELRWYATRTRDGASKIKENVNFDASPKYNATAKTAGFFLSLFADVGFGTTKENKYDLLAEYGAGLGYMLFDSVPFTFQIGFNQKGETVFFLGVVSRIAHSP